MELSEDTNQHKRKRIRSATDYGQRGDNHQNYTLSNEIAETIGQSRFSELVGTQHFKDLKAKANEKLRARRSSLIFVSDETPIEAKFRQLKFIEDDDRYQEQVRRKRAESVLRRKASFIGPEKSSTVPQHLNNLKVKFGLFLRWKKETPGATCKLIHYCVRVVLLVSSLVCISLIFAKQNRLEPHLNEWIRNQEWGEATLLDVYVRLKKLERGV